VPAAPGAPHHRHWLAHPSLLLGVVVVLAVLAVLAIPHSPPAGKIHKKIQVALPGGALISPISTEFPPGTKCVVKWAPGPGGGKTTFDCADGPTLTAASPFPAPASGLTGCNAVSTAGGRVWTCDPSASSNSVSFKSHVSTEDISTSRSGIDWSNWIASAAGALGALAALGAFLVSLRQHH